ncbi:hypothetical protein HID58_075065 [Brassica napus]|uniref:FAD dependent oxidoreductase domain-containing protein n=1 Tax=Brassica napus TaxID=3708 RepID=A0ABQ7YIU8_BRANA|nr:hypothetical protein HID58_075065 [Brassica napus]
MRVAVIGGGVCGLGSAYVLAREDGIEEVVLFEKEESVLGGHAKTMPGFKTLTLEDYQVVFSRPGNVAALGDPFHSFPSAHG